MTRNDDIDHLKGRVRLSTFIERRVKLSSGAGDRFGLCPFHNENTGSFSVNDRKGFYHCFGCGAHGDILDWWQLIDGMTFAEAMERLRREAGEHVINRDVPSPGTDDADVAKRQAIALAIWSACQPIGGTIAETYLREVRCIRAALPDCLRFHRGLRYGPIESDELPAMVAAVTDLDGAPVAIQRTFLARDGSGKADIVRPKTSLGPIGRGAVRLGPWGMIGGVAEGIETGLSAMEMFHLPVWCALGSNLARIVLPGTARSIVIFADRGLAGEEAAEKARRAFHDQGRKVAVRFPTIGKDFNDELKARRNGA
jgi:DNA primase